MRTIGTIELANGETKERSGDIEVRIDEGGSVILRVEKHHAVTFRFTPSIARRIGKLLIEAAGPEKPVLKIVT